MKDMFDFIQQISFSILSKFKFMSLMRIDLFW